jgi:hypothetical protein
MRTRELRPAVVSCSSARMLVGEDAASLSCVPGIFEPLSPSELHERHDESSADSPDRAATTVASTITVASPRLSRVLRAVERRQRSDELADPRPASSGFPALQQHSAGPHRTAQYEDLEARRRGGLLKA